MEVGRPEGGRPGTAHVLAEAESAGGARGAERGESPAQVAKAYGVHPNSVVLWKRHFLERAPEIFAAEGAVEEYERRIRELEQLVGKKEVEIALLKNFLGQSG